MENNISILVIEDEVLIAHTIRLLLQDFGYHVPAVCFNYDTALKAIDTGEYDLVISDINLGDGIMKRSGLVLMKHLREIKNCPFIFLTAFGDKETVKEAAACSPSAYLVKPINEMNLHVAVQLAIENFKNQSPADKEAGSSAPDFFYVKLGIRLVKILWRDIHYMEALKNYVKVYTGEHKSGVLIRGSLQHVMHSMMPESFKNLFVRVTRSMIIARDQINEIGDSFITTPYGKFECTADLSKEGFRKL